MVQEFISNSTEQTEEIAKQFARDLRGGQVIAFEGDLGAGKTCFTKGIAIGLGFLGEVSSPTFALVNEYVGGKIDLYHFDMYRISGWEDLYSTGFFEYLESGGVLAVEWSENISAALPDDTVFVRIEKISDNERKIIIKVAEDENTGN
ncbi:MAG: tRNA (adenosine(37)-N6)-threonylcarbamoyltransferase complex ATPase subunit type 1 TsaE [bacterium]|nr:tRNA (adenosine(37)-N6)-threonylcarbamoyltransferase complex ATPase subunit type 1 TsaE [bacterium]